VPATSAEPGETTLADVYRAHAGFVWRVVRRLGVPEAALEDVVHDVFLVVHRRLHEYDGRAAMTTWLFGIARGVAANHRRGVQRADRKLAVVPPPAEAIDPETGAARSEAAEFVRAFLDGLDEERRLLFHLADVEGMKVPEIAEAMGLNLNTAYSRLRATRELFQRALAERGGRRARSVAG
jgi:RNA polymerase sigma-70 factor (ECF subfamily)